MHLEWEKQMMVTIEDAARILNVSREYARAILLRLASNQWLAPIIPGKYEFIPAERGEHAFVDTNPLFIGSQLTHPYYFSYATSAYFYALTTQAPATVYLAANQGKTRQLTVREKRYQIIVQPAHKFFGFVEVDAYGSKVQMADEEKTLLDSLDRPGYAGDIPEIAAMLWRARNRLDWPRMADFALRFRSQSMLQRLGYLVDALEIESPPGFREALQSGIGNNVCYLGQPSPWKMQPQYNPTWKLMVNIPKQELLIEIEVR